MIDDLCLHISYRLSVALVLMVLTSLLVYWFFFYSMRLTTEVLMHLYPQEDIRIPRVQIRLRVSNPQLVCMRKQQPGMLLDPPSLTSQRIHYSQMRYQARSAGVSRIIT